VEPPVWDAAEFSEPLVFGGANPRAQRMAAGRESIPRRRSRADVGLDAVDRDAELLGDISIGQGEPDEVDDLEFSIGQPGVAGTDEESSAAPPLDPISSVR
jgi:hypothetical protein